MAAAAHACSEESASTTYSRTVAKVAPVFQSSPTLRYLRRHLLLCIALKDSLFSWNTHYGVFGSRGKQILGLVENVLIVAAKSQADDILVRRQILQVF